jgi:hypothetical protein
MSARFGTRCHYETHDVQYFIFCFHMEVFLEDFCCIDNAEIRKSKFGSHFCKNWNNDNINKSMEKT